MLYSYLDLKWIYYQKEQLKWYNNISNSKLFSILLFKHIMINVLIFIILNYKSLI